MAQPGVLYTHVIRSTYLPLPLLRDVISSEKFGGGYECQHTVLRSQLLQVSVHTSLRHAG